jgi:hypothetical protein
LRALLLRLAASFDPLFILLRSLTCCLARQGGPDKRQLEMMWRQSVDREAGLRSKLTEERQQFRARLDEYERLCHSLEQCLQSSKASVCFRV